MSPHQPLTVDQWSPLAHKRIVGHPDDQPDRRALAPTWVPAGEYRRLNAYLARAAYLGNVARELLPADVDPASRAGWREYGDPALLVSRVAAAVLGDHPQIVAAGADTDLTGGPDLPDPPEAPADGDDLAARIHATRVAMWDAEVERLVEEWETAVAGQPAARQAQSLLREWADRIHLTARLTEAARTSVGLGDAIIALWPRPGHMPTVSVHEGGEYFPVLGDDASSPFPDTVHLAYEEDRTDDQGRTERWVRRLTWRLVDITDLRTIIDRAGLVRWADPDGEPIEHPVLAADETVTADGHVTRRLPWHSADTPPATRTCVCSEGLWRLADVQAGRRDALDDTRATWVQPPVDLGVDFLPVIHLPGTPEGTRHYGDSVLDLPSQILDDLASSDGDTAAAAAYLASPTIALSGARTPDDAVIAPGRIFGLGDTGAMSVLDLSAGLDKLHATNDRLLDRLSETTGVTGEVIGRTRADTATSGVHLLLRLAPWAQLVASIRLGHMPKLHLIPRMAWRLGQVAGVIDPGPTPDVSIQPGGFLPTDQAGAVAVVAQALGAHAISVETGVSMLIAAGLPIDDAAVEVARIVAQDTAGLNALADALAGAPGLVDVIAERAGIDLPATSSAPRVVLPE